MQTADCSSVGLQNVKQKLRDTENRLRQFSRSAATGKATAMTDTDAYRHRMTEHNESASVSAERQTPWISEPLLVNSWRTP